MFERIKSRDFKATLLMCVLVQGFTIFLIKSFFRIPIWQVALINFVFWVTIFCIFFKKIKKVGLAIISYLELWWSFFGGMFIVLFVVAIPALISAIFIEPLAKLLSIYDLLNNTIGLSTIFWMFLTFVVACPLYYAFKFFMTEKRLERLNKFFREKLKSPLPWDEFWDKKEDKTKTPSS